jgi:hypothetical protein
MRELKGHCFAFPLPPRRNRPRSRSSAADLLTDCEVARSSGGGGCVVSVLEADLQHLLIDALFIV